MNSTFSPKDDQIKTIAELIAKAMAGEPRSNELESLRESIDEITTRLDRLERLGANAKETAPRITHPSQDRFEIAEAIVDRLFENAAGDKACIFEPAGKPCDHCSMCSSRGF